MNEPKNGEYWIVHIDGNDPEVVELDYSSYKQTGELWRCGSDCMYYDKKIGPDEIFPVEVKYIRKVELK